MINTVVGSFPLEIKEAKTNKEKLLKTIGLFDPYKNLIEEIVELQFNIGIDIITEGQVRGDMIGLFVKHIPGFTYQRNSSVITGKILPPTHNITINDVKIAQNKLNDLLNNSNLTNEQKNKKGIKGIITGPSTIIHSSRIESFYKEKNSAILDYAHAIKNEAFSLEKAGCKYIQIDEPFLSTGMVDLNVAKEAISIISEDINIPISMHVCGNLKQVFKELTNFKVDILDLEFAGNSDNIILLKSNKSLLKNKKLGFGCLDSSSKKLDDENKTRDLIKQGIEIMGEENILLDPDCGLKKLKIETATKKLELMVKLNNELSTL
jgi:5-methyltetrahydropteroyltriglutamate--homocysteine methyltransferase